MKTINRILNEAPLLSAGAFGSMLVCVDRIARDIRELSAAEHPQIAKMRGELKPVATIKDGICMIPIDGPLARKPDVYEMLMLGMEDTQNVFDMIDAAARNPDVKGILLNIDSPGGFITGGPEVADLVTQTNRKKPVVAWTGGTMASLAYWIGSASAQIIASRSAQVGSIGVYGAHVDMTKALEADGVTVEVFKNTEADFKAIGLYGTALNDTQRAHLQEQVQTAFADFRKAVKASRPQVQDSAMRGQVLSGSEAKSVGLIDRVGDLNLALSVLKSEIRARS